MKKMKSVERISILSLLFLLSGCITPNKRTPTIYEDGYFKYIYRGENSIYQDINDKAIVIVGFTDLGLEQEVIDIPREINGRPVEQIGIIDESFSHNDTRYAIAGPKLRKLFVFDSIKYIYFLGEQVNLMICSTANPLEDESFNCKNMYLYWDLYMNIYSKDNSSLEIDDNFRVKPANVSFLTLDIENNFELYRIDNVYDDEKIFEPIQPKREGFLFDGWYIDKNLTNRFDFSELPNIPENEEFVLFGGWKK